MKKSLFFLAVLTMALAVSNNAKGHDFAYTYQGNTLYYILKTDSVTNQTYAVLTYPIAEDDSANVAWNGFARPTGALVIPDSVEWNGSRYAVRELSRRALSACDSLTSVTIPQGVFSIGDIALANCSRLEWVVLPEGVTYLGEYCFCNDPALVSVNIPGSAGVIRYGSLYGCTSLESIVIPEGIWDLKEFVFGNCFSLVSIQLPSTLTHIGGACFQGDSSLVSVDIPAGIDSIHQWTFYHREC